MRSADSVDDGHWIFSWRVDFVRYSVVVFPTMVRERLAARHQSLPRCFASAILPDSRDAAVRDGVKAAKFGERRREKMRSAESPP
jgi:hypothetical protein